MVLQSRHPPDVLAPKGGPNLCLLPHTNNFVGLAGASSAAHDCVWHAVHPANPGCGFLLRVTGPSGVHRAVVSTACSLFCVMGGP